ncbi:hypothetical protein E4U42_007153 [Claviceps africana]|uniref:EXPERA domain-containing protein n=1 Tax=Claviceps africana TaxID=83212 RepID=A0A8K0J3E8_9HYPO|nr:hypothetical protein E4U42_007153 [Claviceps africana]
MATRHVPSPATLAWLALSLPLVLWDTGYVLGRPHTMPGGHLHWLWRPYARYAQVDYVYGWKALRENNGFTAAQSLLNVAETFLYVAYLALWRRRGPLALLLGFSAAVMTLSKTVLYWSHEYYSGFANIGHNDFSTLLFLWIVPNGAWLVGSAYMVMSMGREILDGLEVAARGKQE